MGNEEFLTPLGFCLIHQVELSPYIQESQCITAGGAEIFQDLALEVSLLCSAPTKGDRSGGSLSDATARYALPGDESENMLSQSREGDRI
jgi:hypothetical protein